MIDSFPRSDEPMVVVTGLPRSGTSMMMRMLEAGGMQVLTDGIRAPDQDNPNGYYEYEPVKLLKKDSSWVPGAAGKAVKMVYALLYDLPAWVSCNVIFMQRALEEVVASQDEMLRNNGSTISSEASQKLIELFRRELKTIEAWLAARSRFQVLYVDYKKTIEEPQVACGNIQRFLGLNLDEYRMQSVVTRALYRQRR
jgi:hypothetical protein